MQAIWYMAVARVAHTGKNADDSIITMAKFVAFCDSAKLAEVLAKCV